MLLVQEERDDEAAVTGDLRLGLESLENLQQGDCVCACWGGDKGRLIYRN